MNEVRAVSPNGWNFEGDDAHKAVYKRIVRNLGYPYSFIANGMKGGKAAPKQLFYSCKDSRPPFDNSGLGNCRTGVGAYTSTPNEALEDMWTITFCDLFFKQDYAENLYNGDNIVPADLNTLLTFELTIIHEFFHVDYMGFSNFARPQPDAPHIDDLKAVINGKEQKVYGAALANAFAFLNKNAVNLDTSRNADNYAQYVLSRWVAKRLGGEWNKYELYAPNARQPPQKESLLLGSVDNSTAGGNSTAI
ncbi:hypothetical protein H2200_008083 [Cladophialophora chaetospira]|uniref:Uncharacterized protein n=1 Tax=Cladophialophora chaetospira TaxID=386627 RepID=A0AA38X722_9EURO|nr:hypothetical protein H2200_008083 [Cladophialophora chaetospira]